MSEAASTSTMITASPGEEGVPTECVLDVSGMDCASCVAHVTKAATSVAGVRKADVNLARGRAVVEFDPAVVRPEVIASVITEAGDPSTPERAEEDAGEAERRRIDRQPQHAREWFVRAMAGIALWAPVEFMHSVLPWFGVHLAA